ncbi:hypothetical protein GLOTRDRAFT_101632 [Gloeophyllum trabeum ATCC 11539]|uniref:Uncharacterized protein n=1 Tax=Gloeophyllum trabeum (strain ATCC 11539 / FP-39264 / Madison 617) TaxID=670483 RepID=S7PTJ0_GLOTA|nr:uncharacterized protein GLOTRDRAFT_101632 [Gloeophyllum trabeum ATCC 11539]EPQ50748.1 hypothetical protein GLOTRDRAFT_101632 [Gloeophyllum trabeum ATCC 11539]
MHAVCLFWTLLLDLGFSGLHVSESPPYPLVKKSGATTPRPYSGERIEHLPTPLHY